MPKTLSGLSGRMSGLSLSGLSPPRIKKVLPTPGAPGRAAKAARAWTTGQRERARNIGAKFSSRFSELTGKTQKPGGSRRRRRRSKRRKSRRKRKTKRKRRRKSRKRRKTRRRRRKR